MAKNKNVSIDITGNSKGAENAIDKVAGKLNSFAKKNDQTLSSLNKLNGATMLIDRSFSSIKKAIQKVSASIKECSDLYKVQEKAEKKLETAAKNNPYLNAESVNALKNYASQLQAISDIGDEQLLPMMAQLAAAGRTQKEIQDIMSAALDVSATGAMSLESAVKNLNKTFSGLSGELGESVPAIKSLSQEELKNGKAVEVLAKQYKGMAKANADGSTQFKNAVGDFKEQLGRGWDAAIAPARKALQGWIEKLTESIKKQKDARDEIKNLNSVLSGETTDAMAVSKATKTQTDKVLEARAEYDAIKELYQLSVIEGDKRTKEQEKQYKKLYNAYGLYLHQFQDGTKTEQQLIAAATEAKRKEYEQQQADLNNLVQTDKENREKAAEETAKAQTEAEKKALEERRDLLRKEYDETIANAQKMIDVRRSLGEEISEEAEAQELLNVATAAYIKMYSDPAFDTKLSKTGTWSGQKEQQEQIKGWADKSNSTEEGANHIQELMNSLHPEVAKLTAEITELDKLAALAVKEGLDESSEAYHEYMEKRIELSNRIKEIEEQNSQATKEFTIQQLQEVLDTTSQFVNTFSQAANSISTLVNQNAQNEAKIANAEVEKQYADGIISEEEYYQKKEEIEKEAAEKQYQAQMWAWTASLLQIGVSTAQGIVNALANGGPPFVAIPLAASIGVLGAVQLAAAVASKPIPPSYATGGIIGGASGASLGNDNTYAHVRRGEMILNAKQQRALWDMANGNSGGSGANVEIKNYRGNDTKVDTQFDENGIKLFIRKTVNDDMKNRRYNQSMQTAQNSFSGVRYLN